MNKTVFSIFILLLNCSYKPYNSNEINSLNNYIDNRQYKCYISIIDFFDNFLEKNYSEKDEENRILMFINDFNINYITKTSNKSNFKKSLSEFEPYLKKIGNLGFFDLVKSEDHYKKPDNLDDETIKWLDSIYDNEFINIDFKSNIEIKQQSSDYISLKTTKSKRICGNFNIFIFGLSQSTPKNSFEYDLICKSTIPTYPFVFEYLKDDVFKGKLKNPTIKAFIIYHSIFKLYDCEDNEFKN